MQVYYKDALCKLDLSEKVTKNRNADYTQSRTFRREIPL
jgi:hypothetical protein